MSGRDDDGFTLLETLVSIAVIGVVMAGLGLFVLQTEATSRRQADGQTAAQLTAAAMERVSQLAGAAVLHGRTEAAVRAQWQAPAPGVGAYLDPAATEPVWEDPAAPAVSVALPTEPQPVPVAGGPSKFSRSWYVGACWQPRFAGGCAVVPAADRAGRVSMYRVVVAITWPSKDCPDNLCSYVTATLVGADLDDPTFQ